MVLGSNPVAATESSNARLFRARSSLTFRRLLSRFTLKCVCDVIITYSKINSCNFLSEHSSEFTNFADDTILYVYGKNYDGLIEELKVTIEKLFD